MTLIVEKTDVPADARLPTVHGEFRIRVFHDEETGFDHVALTLGDMNGDGYLDLYVANYHIKTI